MKCFSCDKILSDFEATRKVVREDGTFFYSELCNRCFNLSGVSSIVQVVERHDLSKEDDFTEDFEDIYLNDDEDKEEF